MKKDVKNQKNTNMGKLKKLVGSVGVDAKIRIDANFGPGKALK
jgi:hypothetical protein